MNAVNTTGIVLRRVNYGEADRIITFLTPDQGKIAAIAKGVRKSKSKLAGGIELFSVSEISFIKGKRDIDTLISSRLKEHYGNIVKDLDRTQLAYDFLKLIDKSTEDNLEPDYFHRLQLGLEALDDNDIEAPLVNIWFMAQMLALSGHAPDLYLERGGDKLSAKSTYDFDFDTMHFMQDSNNSRYGRDHIKFLRLIFGDNKPKTISRIEGVAVFADITLPLVRTMLANYIRI